MTDVSFSTFGLSPALLQAIEDLEFKTASPIQAAALPILLGEATDFLGLAATGTGKTAAFAIPMLEKIDPNKRSVQALVLCPTRELALQVTEQINLLGRHKRVRAAAVYGGSSYGEQIAAFRSGVGVVVGTPGRVVDHVEQGTLRLDDLALLVLDEADEMISMGFKDDLEKILKAVPREASNIWLFSATMSREVSRVANDYLREPQRIQINREEVLSAGVEQFYFATAESNKPEVLCKLIEAADDFYGVVFCQTKSLVADLTQYLTERGYRVDCLHGDKDQASRERTLLAFRTRRVNVLVCTDVAARGLDVKDITHVINYSLPRELDNYVHRIGRTARSGKTGYAFNLVSPMHRRLIGQIERVTKSRMLEGRLPTRRELGAKKVNRQFEAFQAQPFHARALEVMSEEFKSAVAGMTAEEVAGRFLNMMMPEIFNDRGGESAAAPMARSERPERSERPSFTPRAERGERPSFGGPRPERNERPSFTPRAERSERPSFGGPRSERPSFAPRAERSERPSATPRAEPSELPSFGPRPLRSERPSVGTRPERTESGERPTVETMERPARPKFFDRAARSENGPRQARPFPSVDQAQTQPTRTVPPYVRAKQAAGDEATMNRRERRALQFGRAQEQLSKLVKSSSAES